MQLLVIQFTVKMFHRGFVQFSYYSRWNLDNNNNNNNNNNRRFKPLTTLPFDWQIATAVPEQHTIPILTANCSKNPFFLNCLTKDEPVDTTQTSQEPSIGINTAPRSAILQLQMHKDFHFQPSQWCSSDSLLGLIQDVQQISQFRLSVFMGRVCWHM